jgi:hypothetical protein
VSATLARHFQEAIIQYELVVLEDQFFTLPSFSKVATSRWRLPPLME